MSEQFPSLSESLQDFIRRQHLFFVGTAATTGRVNVSPKGMDSLRILDANTVAWLNLTGSGNETAAHLLDSNRMTLMFCSFDRQPMILRLYGTADTIHAGDADWATMTALFPGFTGARQVYRMHVDLVQTSCGFAVPFFEFTGERDTLTNWADKRGAEGIRDYWTEKNQQSIDGAPTNIPGANA